MVTLRKYNDTLVMQCHYEYRTRCKSIPGAVFEKSVRAWVAPLSSLPYIEAEFKGELFYTFPRKDNKKAEKLKFFNKPVNLPSVLGVEPFPYQKIGAQFMIDKLNNLGFCMNCDDVGLGKTLQSIICMKYFHENKNVKKFVVFCKTSLKQQWADEILRFTGWSHEDMPIYIAKGARKAKLKTFTRANAAETGVLILSYQTFLSAQEYIGNTGTPYEMCIIDEAHTIKGVDGKMNNAIGSFIRAQQAKTILLTGTPIMSKPNDIWGIVNLANTNYFGTYEEYVEKYIVSIFGLYGEQVIGAKNLDILHDLITRFMIRRAFEEVSESVRLPEVRPDISLSAEADKLQKEMTNIVETAIARLDAKKQEILNKSPLTPRDREIIEKITEKGKMYIATKQIISSDPKAFVYLNAERGLHKKLRKMVPANYKMSPKTEMTIDKVNEIVSAGNKVIIFTSLYSTAKMLKDAIEKELKTEALLYTGKESENIRNENVAKFKDMNSDNYVLIGNQAMSEGLNLQVAKYEIHYEQGGTYADKKQRIGRIRRPGSPFNEAIIYACSTKGLYDDVKIRKIERDKNLYNAIMAFNGMEENEE